jgi:two-component system cell cycle response regulator
MAMKREEIRYRAIVGHIMEMTKKLRKISTLENALAQICETALAVIPGDGASIRLFDETREHLLAAARAGQSVHKSRSARFRRGEGFIGWVAEYGRPALVNDTSRDKRFARRPDQKRDVKSIVCAPLFSGNEVFGVLGVTHRESHAFAHEDVDLLQLLANCAAPSVELARLERLSLTDALTLAFNRRYLERRLTEEIKRARRHESALALIVVDLDHFKLINDTHGHHAGDLVLREVAFTLRQNLREHDVLTRTGGDEFMLLMQDTDLGAAKKAAARLAKMLRARDIVIDEVKKLTVRITASFGITELQRRDDLKSFVARADRAAYKAKRAGRDRIRT